MKTTLLIIAFAALAGTYAVEKFSAAQLAIQLEGRRGSQRELAELQRERDRLRARQATAEETEKLRRAAAEYARLPPPAADVARAVPSSALPLGEWSSARTWQNRGSATPHAAVESTLWAAAGGDVTALKNLFVLGEATREKAEALRARLPAELRDRYATAEDLIAAFTVRDIPLGDAQLVWFNQNGEDDASVCVFLQRPLAPGEGVSPALPPTEVARALTREEAVRAVTAQRAGNRDREPPRGPENELSSETYLSLHRENDGWRLVVPPSAVDKIAKELSVSPGP